MIRVCFRLLLILRGIVENDMNREEFIKTQTERLLIEWAGNTGIMGFRDIISRAIEFGMDHSMPTLPVYKLEVTQNKRGLWAYRIYEVSPPGGCKETSCYVFKYRCAAERVGLSVIKIFEEQDNA